MNHPFCNEQRAGSGALLIAVLVLAAGCGGDDGSDALRPVVDQIAPATAAVEEELGGPQRYFEINATPQLVNLFVARDDGNEVEIYLYHDGELEPPTPPAPASGPTFAASALDFDPDTVLAQVSEDLPDSDIVVFAVTAGADGAPELSATVQSEQGGLLDIALGPTGEVLSVDPRG